MSKTIVIIGDGFIGRNLFRYFNTKYDTVLTNRSLLDLKEENSIQNFFSGIDPTHIIYAAGIKDVKYCEQHHDDALTINSFGISKILRYTSDKSKFIYLSTDYVFDGHHGNYSENDHPNPLTFYGKSKLLGELITQYSRMNSTIVRTSGVYGKQCPWMDWLFKSLKENNKIECYANVINSPTYVMNLAEMIDDVCMDPFIDYTGIINLSGKPLNRYELYQSVARAYHMDEELLYPGFDNSYFPHDISLNTDLYRDLTDKKPDNIKTGLERLLNEN